jgi:hypothetical protein
MFGVIPLLWSETVVRRLSFVLLNYRLLATLTHQRIPAVHQPILKAQYPLTEISSRFGLLIET